MFITLRSHVMKDREGNAPVTLVYVNPKMITHMVWGTAQESLLREGQAVRDAKLVPVSYVYFQDENNFCIVQESPEEIRKLIDLMAR